jgi:hypothetical protein
VRCFRSRDTAAVVKRTPDRVSSTSAVEVTVAAVFYLGVGYTVLRWFLDSNNGLNSEWEL